MKTILRATLAVVALALIFSTFTFAEAPASYKSCAICHGANGEGKATLKTKDFASADVQKMSDAALTESIEKGKTGTTMKGYADKLSKDQVAELVKWIRTLKK